MKIEFRGWSKTYQKWLYGHYYEHETLGSMIIKKEEVTGYQVDSASIGMYTGLKDKNGKKIFGKVEDGAGDIVEHYGEVFHVVFEDGLFAIKGLSERINPDGEYFKVSDDLLCNRNDVLEITHNSFQHPELLEVK